MHDRSAWTRVLAAGCLIGVVAAAWPARAEDPYERGFQQRAERIIEYINTDSMLNRLDRPVWTDHTKYLWPVVLGILHQGPEHPRYEDAVQIMHTGSYEGTWIDEQHNKRVRYNREFFHFAGLGMARLLTQFEDRWDADERRAVIESAVPRHGGLRAFGIGTTNHRTMSITNSYVLTQEAMKLGIDGAEGLHNQARGELLAFAQRLFDNGMAEWDSSTYYAFTISGFMNVYDFAEDPEVREVARAVLDWCAANAAIKYTNGVWGGPESRGGSAYRGINAITDYFGYLWFGDAERPIEEFSGSAPYAIHAVLSRYRPHPAIVAIARREVEAPFESFGSKPTTPVADRGNFARETFFVDRDFSLGTVYERRDGWHYAANQQVTWKLAARTESAAQTIIGSGMTRTHGYSAGRDPWTQVAHARRVLIQMTLLRDDAQQRDNLENRTGSWLSFPAEVEPVQREGALFWELGKVHVAAWPIAGNVRFHEERQNERRLVEDQAEVGQMAGFVLEVAPARMGSFQQFQEAVIERGGPDLSAVAEGRIVRYVGLEGQEVAARYVTDGWHYEYFTRPDRVEGAGHGRMAEVRIDGRRLDLDGEWPIYASPYVVAADGRLRVTDGQRGFEVSLANGRATRRDLPAGERLVDERFPGQFLVGDEE